MNKSFLLTSTGNIWHYNPIGSGIIFSYSTTSRKIYLTCEFSGQIIREHDIEFGSKENFKEFSIGTYKELNLTGFTTSLKYMDDPTIIESGEVSIGVDLELMKN